MRLVKNPRIKSVAYSLFFIFGLILCGYMYYFLHYIPAREARLNEEAISTIRNIREEIKGKESHYRQLLGTSQKLDDILYAKKVASDSEKGTHYIKKYEPQKIENIVLYSDVRYQYDRLRRTNRKSKIEPGQEQTPPLDRSESISELQDLMHMAKWSEEKVLVEKSPIRFEVKTIRYIKYEVDYHPHLKSNSTFYKIDWKQWDKYYQSVEIDADKIIAKNYRDKSLTLLDSTSVLGNVFARDFSFRRQNYGTEKNPNDNQLVTVKDGLDRVILISSNDEVHSRASLTGMVNMNDFMRGTADNDIFDCVVLFDDSTIFYSNQPRILSRQAADSLTKHVKNHVGIEIRVHNINGTAYMQYTAPITIGNEAFHVAGLINQKDFKKYTKAVPYHILITILLIALFLIGIVPSVKIFVITEWERLKSVDVTFAVIGILIGVFVLSMMLLTIAHYENLKSETYAQLINWNEDIEKDLDHEISQTLDELSSKPLLPDSNDSHVFHEYAILDESGEVQEIHLPYNLQSKVDRNGLYFEKLGSETNLSGRAYFYSYQNGSNFQFGHKGDVSYYLQSVFSHKRGKQEAVISILNSDTPSKSDTDYVRLKSTDLKSVMLRNAPLGYEYAVIDRKGNLLFGSDQKKNGLRNIFTQTDGHGFIGKSILSGLPEQGNFVHGRLSYLGAIAPLKSTKTEVGPKGDYPLFILTYIDKSIVTWKTSTSSIILGTVGLFIIVLFLLNRSLFWVLRFKHKDRPLAPPHFNRWLAPRISKLKIYKAYVLNASSALLMLIPIYKLGQIEDLILISFMNVFFLAGLRYGLLAKPSVNCPGYEGAIKNYRLSNVIHRLIYILLTGVLLAHYAESNADFTLKIGLFWLILSLFLLQISTSRFPLVKRITESWVRMMKLSNAEISERTKRWYVAEIIHSVAILIIIPMVFLANKTEDLATYTYVNFALQEVNERNQADLISYKESYQNYAFNKRSIEGPYADSSLFMKSEYSCVWKETINNTLPDSNLSDLLFNKISRIYPLQTAYQPIPTQYIGYLDSDKNLRSHIHVRPNTLGLTLSLLIVFGFLSLAVWLFTHRIFFNIQGLLKSESRSYWPSLLTQTRKQKRYLLVAPPLSIRNEIIAKMQKGLPPSPLAVNPLDFDDIPGIDGDTFDVHAYFASIRAKILSSEIIVVRNWYAFKISGSELSNKLILLNHILDMKECKSKTILLLSSATAQQLESYIKEKSFSKTASFNSRVYFKHFKSIFKAFHQVVLPIDEKQFDADIKSKPKLKMDPGEQVLVKAQYNTPTYTSLWNSLSPEEKFVLYDISDDRMVNSKNWETLLLLKRKGLIKYEIGSFAFNCFDESFSYFVRQSISQEEALEMENIAKKKGSWVPIKIALILIVVALFGLVYNFNPSVLQGFVGIISGIATAIAAFGRIGTSLKIPFIKSNN